MTEREKIAAIIRALRAKKVENGCTEGEALAAAEKLADFLHKHNMTMDEAELRASPFERHQETHADAVGERLWKPALAISKLTGTQFWRGPPGVYPYQFNFFGFDYEVQGAIYLLEICVGAMRREHRRLRREWALLNQVAQRRKILPFLDGMADRLYQRIIVMIPVVPPGKGLVLVRHDLIVKAMALEGIKLKDANARPSRDNEDSYKDGLAAGDKVALNKGVRDHAETQRRIR